MKRLHLFGLLLLSQCLFSQENNFKIGIQGDLYLKDAQGEVYTTSKIPNSSFYSSTLGVLSEDGVNLVNSYSPYLWESRNDFKNMVLNVGNNQMQMVPHVERWFKPTGNNIHSGLNQYNLGDNDGCFLNFDDLYSEVLNNPLYASTVFGIYAASESDGPHAGPKYGLRPSDGPWHTNALQWWNWAATPPSNVNAAIAYFSGLRDYSDQLIMQGQAFHGSYINDDSKIFQFKIADYFKIQNRGDITVEQSYYTDYFKTYLSNSVVLPGNGDIELNKNYLGKFISLDYQKQYFDNIHVDISVSTKEGQNTHTLYSTSTNLANINFNNVWFQAYTSIIHGSTGVWFWQLGTMWEVGPEDDSESEDYIRKMNFENEQSPSRFSRNNFPIRYEKYLSHLIRELRYLKEINILTDKDNMLYSKTTGPDELNIIPACSTYIPSEINDINGRDLYDVVGAHLQRPNTYNNTHVDDEFYGLRYTLRTNGEDIFMIVSNPNPVSIENVPFNFCDKFEIDGVYKYFENGEAAVYAINYKQIRNSGVDWKTKTVVDKEYIPANNGVFNLSFGPLDVHVLKLDLSAGYNSSSWINSKIIPKTSKVQNASDFDFEEDMLYFVREDGRIARMQKKPNAG